MIDYAAIADRAIEIIGSADIDQYMAAYVIMKDETVESTTSGDVFESELSLMSRIGVVDADTILSKIEAHVPARVQRLIQSEKGINLADQQTQNLVASLVQADVLTQNESDQLFAPLTSITLRWPGILPGYIQDALTKHLAGEI